MRKDSSAWDAWAVWPGDAESFAKTAFYEIKLDPRE